ncbi:ABC transporter permease [Pseudothauera nasutitermitis]|uniref:ABC transporter permease n=1 Tax=Pseudothauera nasutitermitis TaxID=2565930 RepID=A0A4S4AVW9_9RHOO|nr:ABC transporter permease [Pseudothauera nasutitermitis]THF63750.1 ABC transporter permease [Pseudothauera nasutitermitis]
MHDNPSGGRADFAAASGGSVLRLSGDWTLAHYRPLAGRLAALRAQLRDDTRLDAAALGTVDTAGASLLFELLGPARLRALLADATLAPERRALLQAVADALAAPAAEAPRRSGSAIGDVLEHIGITTGVFWRNLTGLLGFIGLTLEAGLRTLLMPRRWRVTSLAANLEKTALDAVPIVALLTFLVGAVVAFLGATVLAEFGASIFTVDLVAFSFLREFGVLLAAILVAGRTASAFTAQIGSMKANEEIDAIRVLGLDPVELLVLPRVFALLLALPMLTFVAMLSGIVGGMLVCALTLDISPTMFLSIFENDVGLRHFLIGLGKAPIFAFLIAVIGCREGFKVAGSAQSVGEHTTSAVVQSIFVVILVDAVAALFCMEMGW